jgi:hypothetical protein
VLVQDVRAEAAKAGLDVQRFIERTMPLLPYVPDLPDDEDARLVRCLLEPRPKSPGARLSAVLPGPLQSAGKIERIAGG